MKQVIVGSKNPVKLNATKEAFERVFPEEIFEFITVDAPSDIPDQPFGDEETRRGAKNRAEACRAEYPDAGYYAGLEGGLNDLGSELWVYAWMCVIDTSGKCGYGRTSSFLLPHKICELIHDGRELGDATDIVFNDTNTKHKGGTIGILTSEKITRKDFYREAMIFALIPFLNPDLYWRTPECPEALPRGVRKFGELPNGARSIVPRTISPAPRQAARRSAVRPVGRTYPAKPPRCQPTNALYALHQGVRKCGTL